MASISKSAPRPRKAERKKNPRAQATRKPQAESRKPHIAAVPLGALLDVQDELHQLNAILDGLPGLRQLHAVMAEILKPSKAPEHDRISPWALALTHKPPRAEGNQPCMDEADLIDRSGRRGRCDLERGAVQDSAHRSAHGAAGETRLIGSFRRLPTAHLDSTFS